MVKSNELLSVSALSRDVRITLYHEYFDIGNWLNIFLALYLCMFSVGVCWDEYFHLQCLFLEAYFRPECVYLTFPFYVLKLFY